MDILACSSCLRKNGLAVFTMRDLAVLLPGDRSILRLQLHQWARKGWVARLKRGVYELTYPEHSTIPDFHVANRLYEPSYVSLETALSHYQLIPETAAQVTSVTPKATRRIENRHGLFIYRTVLAGAFTGYRVMSVGGFQVRMAEPEKSLADYLYFAIRDGEGVDPEALRLDIDRIRTLDRAKLFRHAALFGAKASRLKEGFDALLR
ncbi:MAG: hypothetical protein A2X36_04905 [Elusimicrobia bacterium GWA2_69_24]|nr:MAG: hypothetical protein A2X36_04905 [Elusimicrobia bacterium GWA2_69_24]